MIELLKAKKDEYSAAIKAQTETKQKLEEALGNANRNLIALSGALQSTEEIIAEIEKVEKESKKESAKKDAEESNGK